MIDSVFSLNVAIPSIPLDFTASMVTSDSMLETSLVTTIEWTALDTSQLGIPDEQLMRKKREVSSNGLVYIVTVLYYNGTIIDNVTVPHPVNSANFSNLPGCINLTFTLVAMNIRYISPASNITFILNDSGKTCKLVSLM